MNKSPHRQVWGVRICKFCGKEAEDGRICNKCKYRRSKK
jgi:ribosomal protein L32